MDPLLQVIITLLILLLMGYFAYNIYVLELSKLLKSTPGTKKQIDVFTGILDFKNNDFIYDTYNKSKDNYLDINSSINQQGGAEYSYNFWLYTNKEELAKVEKDVVLVLKGEKKFYYSTNNYNCANKVPNIVNKHYNIMIKNPLIRLGDKGQSIVVEFNNINNVESYQQNSSSAKCSEISNTEEWKNKNKNLIGIYDLNFDKKWYMVSIVMKEVSDHSNILLKPKTSCKIYINGINVLDRKVDTRYNDNILPATMRQNKSPLYINPDFRNALNKVYDNISVVDTLKMADLKYFNYAITEKEIIQLYSSGFSKSIASQPKSDEVRYNIVTIPEMELDEKQVKQL